MSKKKGKTLCSSILIWIAPTAFAFPVGPPSYDCDAELNQVERMICDSDVLSYVDRSFSVVYQFSIGARIYQHDVNVQEAQRAWLAQRDQCKTVKCIGDMYLKRTSQLQPWGLWEYPDEASAYWISYLFWSQHTNKSWAAFEQLIESNEQPYVGQDAEFDESFGPGSVLVIDIDGDGVETVGFDVNIQFDHDADGFAELTGFVHPDDGILVLDRNGDGVISDGRELLGAATLLPDGTLAENGFQVLLPLFDSNDDGYFNLHDEGFDYLSIWRDLNQDGVFDRGELVRYGDVGIESIYLRASNQSYVDEHGNQYRRVSFYTNYDGQIREISIVQFPRDTTDTQEVFIPVSDDIAALPDATGFGNVLSLHQAMARDESGELQRLVQQFMDSTSSEERQNLLAPILYNWTGQEGEYRPYYQASIDERKIKTMEAFAGREIGTPNGSGQPYTTLYEAEFEKLKDTLFYQLSALTHLKPFFEKITWTQDESSGVWLGDFTLVYGEILEQLEENSRIGVSMLDDFTRALNGIQGSDLDIQTQFKQQLTAYLDSEDLSGYSQRSIELISRFEAEL
ncbi:hypothetical protein BGP77_17580 [Saccharospirillum sp. MSK14-1]|uniref:lysozyme inhibitor LprI family protein n=1 Tax=Saccharospirillum sp. MSK14-1 TaxID=1897632 RepID=UPI000D3A7159|nr:hypothetical protein [Saccharospirillum sp. MSK14-1]PTY38250.1 hypothetical protein BGP77_17580 [Saccharospirillum sp. MSK14-1]